MSYIVALEIRFLHALKTQLQGGKVHLLLHIRSIARKFKKG